MIKTELSSISLEDKISSIKSDESFVSLKDLPDYYKNAVIAVGSNKTNSDDKNSNNDNNQTPPEENTGQGGNNNNGGSDTGSTETPTPGDGVPPAVGDTPTPQN